MSSIFPLRETVSLDDGREPRLVDLDDDVADDVFKALAARTTREIFSSLHQNPQTASDLAEVTDTSVQNVKYHLDKLVEAGLVEVVDTWYSERGTEMNVYAPTDESLVLFAGDDKRRSLRTLLKRVVGVVAFLLPASAVVAWLARQLEPGTAPASGGESPAAGGAPTAAPQTGGDTGVGGAADPTSTPATDGGVSIMDTANGSPTPQGTPTPTPGSETANTTTPAPTEPADAAVDAALSVDPAVLAGSAFFLGGLAVLAVVATVYWRQQP